MLTVKQYSRSQVSSKCKSILCIGIYSVTHFRSNFLQDWSATMSRRVRTELRTNWSHWITNLWNWGDKVCYDPLSLHHINVYPLKLWKECIYTGQYGIEQLKVKKEFFVTQHSAVALCLSDWDCIKFWRYSNSIKVFQQEILILIDCTDWSTIYSSASGMRLATSLLQCCPNWQLRRRGSGC